MLSHMPIKENLVVAVLLTHGECEESYMRRVMDYIFTVPLLGICLNLVRIEGVIITRINGGKWRVWKVSGGGRVDKKI